MKKEWLLAIISSAIALLIAIGLMRWFAPQLLGIPVDLRLVRVGKKIAPFFDGVFRDQDYHNRNFIIADPYVERAKPLYPDQEVTGPHDLLGFRNRSIPDAPDIITIGDSQTYGNNALLEQNWPSQLAEMLEGKANTLYNMSVGGWGATEYFQIFKKAIYFHPRLVIVAFYTGNDPLDTCTRVYDDPRWKDLRPDPSAQMSDRPEVTFPPPPSECWPVTFHDGLKTIFTPRYRHLANMDHPVVQAGYKIMAAFAKKMGAIAQSNKIKIDFTIIPTKELVYARKIKRDGISPTPEYSALIRDEQKNIKNLSDKLRAIPGVTYINLVAPLQQEALGKEPLYPDNMNGHPIAAGYKIIAQAIARIAINELPDQLSGPVLVNYDKSHRLLFLARDHRLWLFSSQNFFLKNGWQMNQIKLASLHDIANLPYAGIIHSVDPSRFGPYADVKLK